MRKFLILVVVMVMLLTISLLAMAESSFPKFILIGGGSTGGVFFSAASGFAQLISENTPTKASAQTTTGGGQNIQLLANKEIDLAIADNLVVKHAYEGIESFDGQKVNTIRAICNIYPSYFQQVVRVGSGIETMDEIRGHNMVVGGPGSGTEIATRMVYTAHDIDYTNSSDIRPEFLGISAGVEKIQNQQADGMTSITPFPFSSFVELTMTNSAKLISLDDVAIQKLTEEGSPYMAGIIPAETYQNQDVDVSTIYMRTLLITTEDMDEGIVYEITKLIYENLEYLNIQHSCFQHMELVSAADGISIPLHPGAERYYKEIGILD